MAVCMISKILHNRFNLLNSPLVKSFLNNERSNLCLHYGSKIMTSGIIYAFLLPSVSWIPLNHVARQALYDTKIVTKWVKAHLISYDCFWNYLGAR